LRAPFFAALRAPFFAALRPFLAAFLAATVSSVLRESEQPPGSFGSREPPDIVISCQPAYKI
jgi:hypothetical protein